MHNGRVCLLMFFSLIQAPCLSHGQVCVEDCSYRTGKAVRVSTILQFECLLSEQYVHI